MLSVDEQMRIITSGAAQIVPEADLRKKLEKGEPLNIKLGVDPTSPDLHLGHAVPLRKMRQFQDLGHNVTLIIGNGTALIGDPSGKNSTRPQLSQEQIEANAETYVSQAMKILDPEKTTIVHNGDWILSMDLAGLLQVCSKFTVARILERDDFTKRYQSQTPIALHEFLYPVMQAFDSVQIKADVEMGGTDQLFNLLAGRELMEKMGMEPQIALTMPLLEGTEGERKISKSNGHYIGQPTTPKAMFGITMSNPGSFRIELDAAKSGGVSDPRNGTMLKMFNLIDIGERAGSGIPNIFRVWREQGWAAPTFTEQLEPERTILSLTFEKIGDKKSVIKIGDKKSVINEKMKETIIAYLTDHAEAKTAEIAAYIGLKLSRTRDYLYELIAEDIVVAEGGNRNRTYRLRS